MRVRVSLIHGTDFHLSEMNDISRTLLFALSMSPIWECVFSKYLHRCVSYCNSSNYNSLFLEKFKHPTLFKCSLYSHRF